MEADHPGERRAHARELQRAKPAQAVTHRADALGIDIWPRDQRVIAGAHMAAQPVVILAQRSHEVHRILGLLRGAAAAIHIDGKRDIAELGDHARAALRVIGETGRLMDDHARPDGDRSPSGSAR